MKILVYENRKCDPEYYDASTPEKASAAYLALFETLDNNWDVYCELADFKPEVEKVCEPCQKELHRLCEKDNCCCAADEQCSKRARRLRIERAETKQQQEWYKAAKSGDAESARWLITARSGYEYERVQTADVIDPTSSE
jgi:hypothetical protein